MNITAYKSMVGMRGRGIEVKREEGKREEWKRKRGKEWKRKRKEEWKRERGRMECVPPLGCRPRRTLRYRQSAGSLGEGRGRGHERVRKVVKKGARKGVKKG